MTWLDSARQAPLPEVLQHLGVGRVQGNTVGPCPACGVARRGSADRRGPCNVHEKDGAMLWKCQRCDVGGDGIRAVCLSLYGRRFAELGRDEKSGVQDWYSDRGWCAARREHRRPIARPRPPSVQRVTEEDAKLSVEYPPPEEVSLIWDQLVPASDQPRTWRYLQDRGYWLPSQVDLARTWPDSGDIRGPGWWPAGWVDAFPLVFAAYDASGALSSLHARWVPQYGERSAGPASCSKCCKPLLLYEGSARPIEKCGACGWKPDRKTTWPRGYSSRRLLFADEGGVALLRGEPQHKMYLVVEGVTDTLRAASIARHAQWGVLGLTSGGPPALSDVRWPDGAVVGVAMDPDPAGEKYADEISDHVHGVDVRKVTWGGETWSS